MATTDIMTMPNLISEKLLLGAVEASGLKRQNASTGLLRQGCKCHYKVVDAGIRRRIAIGMSKNVGHLLGPT